ncbi:hypothetical protein Ancab_033318 [Ancistrocladus abbreviatus]
MMIPTTSTITTAYSRNQTSKEKQEQIKASTCPSWKLYQNPFYISQQHQKNHLLQHKFAANSKHIQHFHLKPSARRIAASFWDLGFYRPAIMESEIDDARARVVDLKADLEFERRVREKMETLNKRMAEELAEERKAREAVERVCDQLAREISEHKAEMEKMKREIEEEREMLRVAEVLREERVQMKLTEAKLFYGEKLAELEQMNQHKKRDTLSRNDKVADKLLDSEEDLKNQDSSNRHLPTSRGRESCIIAANYYSYNDENSSSSSNSNSNSCSSSSNGFSVQRKASPEPENPHIRRGIKGFVEFPRVVKAIESRNTSSTSSRDRDVGTKLECQKAQLRILLKQRAPFQSNNPVIS